MTKVFQTVFFLSFTFYDLRFTFYDFDTSFTFCLACLLLVTMHGAGATLSLDVQMNAENWARNTERTTVTPSSTANDNSTNHTKQDITTDN